MHQQKPYAIRCSTEEQARECLEKGIMYTESGFSQELDKMGFTQISYEEALSMGLLGEKKCEICNDMDILEGNAVEGIDYPMDTGSYRREPQKVEPVKESRLATQRIKYPVKDDGQGMYIFDEKGSMICQVRGWGELQKQTNGIKIQDDVAKFISEAINEKLSKESPSEDNLVEKRKDVKGYKNDYKISNCGNVKGVYGYMHPTLNSGGYLSVTLKTEEKIKSVPVHRLVAEYFVDGIQDGLEVNHKNTNRFDNRADNLEWVTRQENMSHAFRMGGRGSRTGKFGKYNPTSRKINQYTIEGDFIKSWDSIHEAVVSLGYKSSAGICMCCKGHPKHKTSGGYKREYLSSK